MWLDLFIRLSWTKLLGGKVTKGWKGKCLDSVLNGPLHFPSRFFQIHRCQPLQFVALSCVMEAKNSSCYHEASNAALVCNFPPNSITFLTCFCNFASASGIMKPLLCKQCCHCDQPILIRVLEQDGRYTYNVTLWRVWLTTDAVKKQQFIVCVCVCVCVCGVCVCVCVWCVCVCVCVCCLMVKHKIIDFCTTMIL